jgi:hypothetical protein
MYRNYLSKQLQSQLLLSPAAPVEHANSANLATDQMESRKRKLSVEHEDSEADADYENQAVSANGKRAILSKQEQETSQDSLELLAMEDAEMEYALRLSREECGLEDNTERQQLGEGSRHPDGRDEEEDIEFEKAIKASEEMYERETLARNALPVQETRPAKRRFWDMPVREKRTADGLTDEVAE